MEGADGGELNFPCCGVPEAGAVSVQRFLHVSLPGGGDLPLHLSERIVEEALQLCALLHNGPGYPSHVGQFFFPLSKLFVQILQLRLGVGDADQGGLLLTLLTLLLLSVELQGGYLCPQLGHFLPLGFHLGRIVFNR